MAVAKKKAAAEDMAETKKTTTRKRTVKQEAAALSAEEKEVKEEKKAPARKTTTRRTKKTAPETTVMIEYAGRQLSMEEIVKKASEAFVSANPDTEIKTLEVYVQPEENVAYYVVNGEGSEHFKVEL